MALREGMPAKIANSLNSSSQQEANVSRVLKLFGGVINLSRLNGHVCVDEVLALTIKLPRTW